MNITTLEQSRKLKELGAPQDTTHFCWFDSPYKTERGFELEEAIKVRMNPNNAQYTVAAYTLEELIEWLGDDFAAMYSSKLGNPHFVAQGTVTKALEGKRLHKLPVERKGATPIKAVYNLALAINPLEDKGE